ncbi:sodium:solute symporter family protein [Alicyclobacillus dauci]|uniref:Sodium:solute symporter family protein n=1 Tax=Alicyclobacillus dauci TaxID=1475485 RepID=A0ABY6YZH3_9BACL|nr:hypothetical protein [Alicyclobacillus dauci]WAH35673.1 hypothetical protein NZD86_15510 [Alicyclobacillus dauci]
MIAMVLTAIFILIVVMVGFSAGFNKASRSSLEEWSVGGRKLGPFLVWFLIGADTYSAATFLGITGYAYNFGAPAFYGIAYLAMAYPLGYFILPRLWRFAKERNLTTIADYARVRYNSRVVSVLVSLTSLCFLIPYIDLQLTGITGVVKVAGQGVFKDSASVGVAALVISFALVAFYTFFSGLRAPAWTAVIKDALVWIVLITMMLTIPFIWFHGWGSMFSVALQKIPNMLTLHAGPHDSIWFSSTALMTAMALFMWPHSSTGAFSSRSEEALRKSMLYLPFYNLLVFFLTWLGIVDP